MFSIILSFLLLGSTVPLNYKDKEMADLPAHIGSFFWLSTTDEPTMGVVEAPMVCDIRTFKFFYNDSTNRLVILGDDEGRKEIPTYNAGFKNPSINGFAIINGAGEVDSTFGETYPDPMIGFIGIPYSLIWPARGGSSPDRPRAGSAIVTTTVKDDTFARDGTTPAVYGRTDLLQVEHIPPYAGGLEWNTAVSSSVQMWVNNTEYKFIVTKFVLRNADADFTAFTDDFTAGTNSTDFNNIIGFKVNELVDPLDVVIVQPNAKFRVVEAGDGITINPSGVSTGHFTIDIWGYYV